MPYGDCAVRTQGMCSTELLVVKMINMLSQSLPKPCSSAIPWIFLGGGTLAVIMDLQSYIKGVLYRVQAHIAY